MPDFEPRLGGGTERRRGHNNDRGSNRRPDNRGNNHHNENNQQGEQIYTNNDLIEVLQAFSPAFEVPHLICYPGSNVDTSPSVVFTEPDQQVVYIDNDPRAINTLTAAGYKAVLADATKAEANPGVVDLMIFENATTGRAYPVGFIREGGYVIAQKGWNDDFTPLVQYQPGLKLVGVYDKEQKKYLTADLEDYLIPTEKDEQTMSQHYKKEAHYYVFKKIDPEQQHEQEHTSEQHPETETHQTTESEKPVIKVHQETHSAAEQHSEKHGEENKKEKKPNIFKRAWEKIKNFFKFSFFTGNSSSELYQMKKKQKEEHGSASHGH